MTSAPRSRQLWIAISAIFVPLVVLAGVEVCLRWTGIGYPTALLTPCTVQGKPASCYNLFFAAPFFPAGSVQSPRLYSIPAQKPSGTYRIFVLGESAAMGDPDPAYGFSRYLEVMLRERFPAINFEVVNTGSVAINSHVVLRIAKQLAEQRPDLFIIYSGNNEVVGPYGPGTVLTSSGMSIPVIRSSIFLRSTRIGQLVSKLGTQKKTWQGMEMFLDKQVRANSPLMQQVYANYERNLRDTIEVGRAAGAQVIVATAATNLEDCAPFASLHSESIKAEELSQWSLLVQRGNEREAARSFSEALELYRSAAKIDNEYAERHTVGTINIPFTSSFVTWAGWLAQTDEVYLIIDGLTAESRLEEASRALAMIGTDRITGYFDPSAVTGQATIAQMTAQELKAKIDNVIVIDVRAAGEFKEGHLPGAVHMPLGYLAERATKIPVATPIVVQCQVGGRSAIAASILERAGFTNVTNLTGGIAAWAGAGLPVEK